LNQNGSGVVEKIDMATLYVSGASTVLFEKMNLQELALREADWTTYARDGVPEPKDDQDIGVSIREPNPWVKLAEAIPADAIPICQAPALTYLDSLVF